MRLWIAFLTGLVVVVGVVAVSLAVRNGASAAGTGPTMEIGAPSLVSGKVNIPINASGSGFDPYIGFNAHLRWDPTIFSFSSANGNGGVIVSPLCASAVDPDGAGVALGCASLNQSTPTTTGGLLGTIILTPVGTGCSTLHIVTMAETGGDTSLGSYTLDTSNTPQTNAYGPDTGANELGASCTPAGPPTSTPTSTNTPTPSPTPSPTSTPSPTPTTISGFPDVTISISGSPISIVSGGTVSYTAAVANLGDALATGVAVDIALPQGAVPTLNSYCRGFSAWHVLCALPNLAANDHAPGGPDEVTIILVVREPYHSFDGPVAVTATVSAGNEPPANNGNNTAQTMTGIAGCPDLNSDNSINLLDIGIAAAAFGTHQGQPGFNPYADMDQDGAITVIDLGKMGAHMGQKCTGLDGDLDGLSNYDEVNIYHTDPNNPDTDGDSLPDGIEVFTYGTNPMMADTDQDGYNDGQEVALGKSPLNYCAIMRADVNMDGSMNLLDFGMMAPWMGSTIPPAPARLDQGPLPFNNKINLLDFGTAALVFGHKVSECP